MNRKRCWFSNPSLMSKEFGQKMIWNSSSTSSSDENEDRVSTSKRLKHNSKTPDKTAVINREFTGVSQYKENDLNSVFQNNQFESFFPINSSPSPILGRYLLESNSPILGLSSIMTKSDSPILYQRQIIREGSPVLTNLEIVNSIRMRKKARKFRIQQSPPKFFKPLSNVKEQRKYRRELITIEPICSQDNESTNNPSEEDLVAIEPTCSQKIPTIDFEDELITIVPICSQKESIVDQPGNELISIEPICSQDSLSTSTVDQSVSLSGSSNASQCYHQPKMRKKQCKPGGLLHQIQQTINLQASRMSLWHHDVYWKKIESSEFEHIQCYIQKYWKEFGCTTLECCDFENKEKFLVCLGHNTTAVLFDVENVEFMKIFPPFKEKWIERDNKKIKVFYNVTKILLEKNHKELD